MKERFVREFSGDGTRILDTLNDDECVYEYGIDDSKTLCELLNESYEKNKRLRKILNIICNIYSVFERDSVKCLIVDELRGLDAVSYDSSIAWNEFVILSKFFNEQYDDDYREYL